MQTTSKQQIVLIHGRGSKPNPIDLKRLWIEALAAGLQRDAPQKVDALHNADIHMIYYADQLTSQDASQFDESLDLDNRHQALRELSRLVKAKEFRRKHYEVLPGKTALKEFAMDLSASVGLGGAALGKAIPELKQYWGDKDGWAKKLRDEVTNLLAQLTQDGENVLIISHCMGSVLAWDALWALSQEAHSGDQTVERITRWITIGSPLGDRAVQSRLSGSDKPLNARYPAVLNAWYNISAEDDYVCHDKTVSDDYANMLKQKVIGDIRDHTIYNLSVRYGRSNPHSSVGYLIHPRTAALVADWLD